jgi:hypothetical protein
MTINYISTLQEPRKFTQIGIFGLKIHHLATLKWRDSNNVIAGKIGAKQGGQMSL